MTEIEKLTAGHPDTQSADIVAGNIEALRALFPEAFTEGKIDFEVLKQCLGGAVDDREEKYGLNWHGKRRARQIALTPSTGTLLPCPEDSVDWDTTQNLMIEGDNLEVLKLLQKSYVGEVKLVYIDPPYNTGSDFVYEDDFTNSIQNYLEVTGQVQGGKKITSNTSASGRFHTDWLNMIYPRLKLAKSLLAKDGILMISIDDNEVQNLRIVCDDIFGEESFLIQFVWRRRSMADSRNQDRASTDHEYVVCYKMPEAQLMGTPIDQTKYSNPDNDPRGPWFSADLTGIANKQERPNLHYDLVNPDTGIVYPPSPTRGWSCSLETMQRLIAEDRVLWPAKPDGRPRSKKFLNEVTKFETGFSSWLDQVGQTSEGTQTIQRIFGEKAFQFSKPPSLMKALIEQTTKGKSGIILDFFAGSGTTAQAVMELNSTDGGSRRFILVQLPEPMDSGFSTIADLTRERLRRVAKEIANKQPLIKTDLGFRAYKLGVSNIRAWSPEPSDLEGTLLAHAEHLVPGRNEADILTELLLKLGLDLCVPIETKDIAGKSVHSVGAGALIVCLSDGISRETVEGLAQGIIAWWQALAPAGDTRIVFKDSAFADDVAKTNMAAILNQAGIKDMRSL